MNDLATSTAKTKADKAQVAETEARLLVTINRLDDVTRDTATQLRELNTAKGEPRLEDGAEVLSSALDEFAPVVEQVDAWMTAYTGDAAAWEVVARSRGIIKLVFPGLAPTAKPLTSVERSPGFMKHEAINAHLDAAVTAAESVRSGNRYHADRVVLHAKDLHALLENHPRITGGFESRIKKLLSLVDQILDKNPYLERSFREAIDPIRNVK